MVKNNDFMNFMYEQNLMISDMPREVHEAISKIMYDIEQGITENKAPDDNNLSGYVNVIPSKNIGACTPILITYCYDKDSFEGRILESLDHVTLNCPGINKTIAILTTQWESRVIKKQTGYIESVRKNNIETLFVYVSKKGFTIMPV